MAFFMTSQQLNTFFLNFILFFYTAGSYQLPILYTSVYTCQSQSPNSSHHHQRPPLSPLGVHTFVLYICVSIFALQTGSSVPFFQVPHICVNIRYLFFSFSLTSLCMTVSRSIHFSKNDLISFLFMANIPLYISSLSICLSMGIKVASITWLL